MGNICSSSTEGAKANQDINLQIEKERKKKHNEVKLLLLGAGESVTAESWSELTEDQGKQIKGLWADPGVKQAMKRVAEFSTLPDSAP
eukprot:gene7880-9250_t